MECCKSLVLALVLFSGLAVGEVIRTQKCYLPAKQVRTCTVHEVRVSPCPEAAESPAKPCKIKSGDNVTLSFDYTPTWDATKVGSQAAKVGTALDIPWADMDPDGCKYTSCPVEANKQQVYNYQMHLPNKEFPLEVHQVKWKLFQEEDYHKQCCFKFSLQLV